MTPEVWYLFLSSVLLAVLWIPHIAGQVWHNGLLRPDEYRTLRDPNAAPDWVRRANRAHVNLVEQFGAFAGLVAVGQFASISTATTAICAAVFFWARLAHAVVMISGTGFVRIRTAIFTVAWATLMVFAWQLFANAV
jgi:uncharacterized MAPEG superfamily protein